MIELLLFDSMGDTEPALAEDMQMLMQDALFVLTIASSFVFVLLAVFLFTANKPNFRANRLFAGFLILTVIDLSGWLLQQVSLPPAIIYLKASLAYLQMPLFLGFFYASCKSDFRVGSKHMFHAIPFAMALVLCLTRGINWDLVLWTLHLQYFVYMFFVFKVTVDTKREFETRFSDERSKIYKWLFSLALVSIFAHVLVLIRSIAINLEANDLVLPLQLLSAVAVLFISSWITFAALANPELFRGITDGPKQPRSRTLYFEADELDALAQRLRTFMGEERPHLDSELTLDGLASRYGVAPRELSQLINEAFGMHYFDFVNLFRVESAKELLANSNRRITEIMYGVGFNSKSSFNTAFKKHTGCSPTSYRRSKLKTE